MTAARDNALLEIMEAVVIEIVNQLQAQEATETADTHKPNDNVPHHEDGAAAQAAPHKVSPANIAATHLLTRCRRGG
ncbi:MAG: hypothetical protein L0Z53_02730 [Acidobacteriales bacterium]|nr:hypothetical protein [Terriglobales bacterium]